MAKKINGSVTGLGYYYDEEIFNRAYTSEKDPTSTVLIESGVMEENSEIANMIEGGGNFYTLPFYTDIDGNYVNYDGNTNITLDEVDAAGQEHGVVWGRAKGWTDRDFVKDFSSADPMRNILNRVQKWEAKKRQGLLIGILEALFSLTGSAGSYEAEFASTHILNIASANSTVTDANKISLTTLRDLAVKANGDAADDYSLAIMHSVVANRLSQFNVLEYFKYNDANGQERDVKVGRSGNMLVLVCDEVPHSVNATSGAMEYTTYVFGNNAIGYAQAPVDHPSSQWRDETKNGGMDCLATRYRETILPYGFSFEMQNLPVSPTDTQLTTTANWSIVYQPKNIYIGKLVSNG